MATFTPVNDTPEIEMRWALLERIAASVQLRRANRLQELLYFLGKRSLIEHCESLHEQAIGVAIFGRPEGYDTSSDNIVRTSVSELRKRVQAYFDAEGREEPVIMEIPRWNYALAFRDRPVPAPVVFPVVRDVVQTIPTEPKADPAPRPQLASHSMFLARPGAIFLFVALAIACLMLLNRYRALSVEYSNLHRATYAWQYNPELAELWNGIFSARPNTDIVLADASFGLLQDINHKSFSLDDYVNRSYSAELQSQRVSSDLRPVLERISSWNLGSQDEFMLARRILALDPTGNIIRLYSARNYVPALTKRDNLILIGGRLSNPWQDLFELHSNFVLNFAPTGSITVTNRKPEHNEQATYVQTASSQYCVVSYLPNPDHTGIVLLIQGTDAEATEAAGDFLLSGEKLAAFEKLSKVTRIPYFEVLLRVSSVPGTPLTSSIEAFRTYGTLR